MNRKIIALIVTIILSIGAFYFGGHLNKKYGNAEVTKTNEILNKMTDEGITAFELEDIHGKKVSSDVLKGKLGIINFWASWCDPCVREFPSMLSLVKHFKGELILVAISNDENFDDMMSFVKAFDADQPNVYMLRDPDRKVAEQYGTYKLPETFMVGPDLKLIRKIVFVEKWYTPSSIEYISDVIESYKK